MAPEPVCLSLVLLVTIQGVLCIRHESQGDTQNRLNNRIGKLVLFLFFCFFFFFFLFFVVVVAVFTYVSLL